MGLTEEFAQHCHLMLDYKESTKMSKEYYDRLDDELSVIKSLKLEKYFLYVQRAIQLARDNNIMVGAGRGSGAGSLVNYLLGITYVDPIKHNLLFSRFLNLSRKDAADIDSDFSDRKKLVELLSEKYKDYDITPICNKNTLGLKNTIAYMFKTFGINYPYKASYYDSSLFFSKLIDKEGIETLDDFLALSESKKMLNVFDKSWKEYDFKYVCEKLIGNQSAIGVHAGGVLYLKQQQINVPYTYSAKKEYKFISAYSESGSIKELEEIGEIKFDYLGVKTLKYIQTALEFINDDDLKKRIVNFDLNMDDENVYKHLKLLMTKGIFQLQSDGMKNLIKQFKPKNIEDLSMLIAIYRPGVLNANIDKLIIESRNKVKRGISQWDSKILSIIRPIVEETHYNVLYQEQVMQIGQVIGEYNQDDLNNFRKFISNKYLSSQNPEKYKKWKVLFYDSFILNGIKKGVDKVELEKLWKDMEGMSSYIFNKSHSIAYAYNSFVTAYLAHYHPLEWYASLLRHNDLTEYLPIVIEYISRRRLDIEIVTPKHKHCNEEITINGNRIILGLASVKGVGNLASQELMKIDKYDVGSLEELQSLEYNKRALTSGVLKVLVSLGFFETFEMSKVKQYEYLLTQKLSKVKKTEFNVQSVIQNEDVFFYNKEIDAIGVPISKYPLEDVATKLIGDLYSLKPELAETEFCILNQIVEIKSAKTKSFKSYLQVTSQTVTGKEMRFNIFHRSIVVLKNIFNVSLDKEQDRKRNYILFYVINDGFVNVEMMIPIT